MDSVLTDVRYALGQLRAASVRVASVPMHDHLQRALDALERVEQALVIATEPVDLSAACLRDWSAEDILAREG